MKFKMKSIFLKQFIAKKWTIIYRNLSSVSKLSPEVLSQYESVIGLEVHSQITSNSKLFSTAGTTYLSAPNSQVSFFDCALPGTLPVLNKRCVESAVLTGLALNCQISKRSMFDRKHYFYADMPAGYQITQQREPIATNGYIEFIAVPDSSTGAYMKRSNLKQIQLEQDSGKSLQDNVNSRALVDLNRAGVGLIEFVFEPDLKSAAEAVSLIKHLILILRSINTCSCKMEEGVLRVDANISVRKPNQPLGVRTEVKNLNSFRFIHSAIEYEINRQIVVIESGGQVVNETRMYDMKEKQTIPMRDKEVVQDYRFMPEPNLPPILLCDDNHMTQGLINISDFVRKMNSKETPNQLRDHLIHNFCLTFEQIFILMNEKGMTDVFTRTANCCQSKQFNAIFDFINQDLRLYLEDSKQNFEMCSVDPKMIAQVIDLLVTDQISSRIANQLIGLYISDEKRTPNELIEENNWKIIKDIKVIESMCLSTIESLPKIARRYTKSGQRRPKSKLIENVMKLSNNRVNEIDVWIQFDRILKIEKNVNKI